MVGAHQAVFDRNLARDEVDQPAMDEVRADPPRALSPPAPAISLSIPGKAADARADRDAGALLRLLVHVGQAGVFERLAGGVDGVDDERVDLALDLVVDALVGIEAIFVIGRLHFAGDLAFWSLASKRVIGASPLFPAMRFCQVVSTSPPAASPARDRSRRHGALLSKLRQASNQTASRLVREAVRDRRSAQKAGSNSRRDPISPCSGRYTRSRRERW